MSESLLEWVKVNSHLMETECGRFRCRKYRTGEDVVSDPGRVCYQLYGANHMRLGPPMDSFVAIKSFAQVVR